MDEAMDMIKTLDQKYDYGLWRHAKRLIKRPFSRMELYLCLRKSVAYERNHEAAFALGRFSLFEYPIEKPQFESKFNETEKTFCSSFSIDNEK